MIAFVQANTAPAEQTSNQNQPNRRTEWPARVPSRPDEGQGRRQGRAAAAKEETGRREVGMEEAPMAAAEAKTEC